MSGAANTWWRDWAGMARLPNVPTVWSNVFTAWVVTSWAGPGWELPWRWPSFVLAVLGGTMAYVGGTILNDVADVEFDRIHRSERPIPAGRIARLAAAWVACLLLSGGYFALTGASVDILYFKHTIRESLNGVWVTGNVTGTTVSAAALVYCILGYTWVHKRGGWWGPVLMGLCRVVLGWTVAMAVNANYWNAVPWLVMLWAYIVMISVIARGETKAWRRKAVGVMLAGLPLVDAVFLVLGGQAEWVWVPLVCMGLAIALRKVAAAT